MATEIRNTIMISDVTPVHAYRVSEGDWIVSAFGVARWSRNDALTAMALAEIVATTNRPDLLAHDALCVDFAHELGLSVNFAVSRLRRDHAADGCAFETREARR